LFNIQIQHSLFLVQYSNSTLIIQFIHFLFNIQIQNSTFLVSCSIFKLRAQVGIFKLPNLYHSKFIIPCSLFNIQIACLGCRGRTNLGSKFTCSGWRGRTTLYSRLQTQTPGIIVANEDELRITIFKPS